MGDRCDRCGVEANELGVAGCDCVTCDCGQAWAWGDEGGPRFGSHDDDDESTVCDACEPEAPPPSVRALQPLVIETGRAAGLFRSLLRGDAAKGKLCAETLGRHERMLLRAGALLALELAEVPEALREVIAGEAVTAAAGQGIL